MPYGSLLDSSSDTRELRKGRGAFFTPPKIACYLAEYAVRTSHDRVIEPSCGEGEFLLAAADRLRSFGASSQMINGQLVGCELHGETVEMALRRLAAHGLSPHIEHGNFFDQDPVSDFDAVLGNPPYIRFQEFSGEERAVARQDALRAGVNIDAQASAWAPFIVHASLFLRKGGRMAFVLPAELLSTNYAAPVRRYLLEQFPVVQLILFEQSVFPEVQEEVVLLMAEGFHTGSSESIRLRQVFSVRDLRTGDTRVVRVGADDRWPIGHEGQAARSLLSALGTEMFVPLDNWGDIRLGAVTGRNGYFALTAGDVQRLGLKAGLDVVPLCPPGSRHLRRLNFDNSDWNALAEAGKRVYLFYPHEEVSAAAEAYIENGEAEGVNRAYKCRARTPWWRVPGLKMADAFFTYMNGYGPNICSNMARVNHLNSVHGIFYKDETRDLGIEVLPLLTLSSITQLSAEISGRSYGGGILKLEPREASRLLVPTPAAAETLSSLVTEHRAEVDALLVLKKREEATRRVDDLLVGGGVVSKDAVDKCAKFHAKLARRRKERGSSKHAGKGKVEL